jgi:hypothetical protein
MSKTNKSIATPPTEFSRNEHGLISSGLISYVFNEDGSVDWRKMVRSDFLRPNRQKTQETDLDKLRDDQLIILLGGLKYLAQVRGYSSVTYDVVKATREQTVAKCSITWIPNYETEGREIVFEAIAGASLDNTNDFGQVYLPEMAENRAFGRCIRNFLKINIVSQDELGPNKGYTTSKETPTEEIPEKSVKDSSPAGMLRRVMEQKNVTFSSIRDKLIDEGYKKADNMDKVEDLPKTKIFELLGRIKNKK